MLSVCAPHSGCLINPTAYSGQDQDPSNETIVAPLSREWGGILFPMVKHSKKTPLSTEGNTILGIAAPEEHGAENIRYLVVRPMFAQHVCRIFRSRDVPEVEDIGGDGFTNPVVGECGPSLVELGVRDSAAGSR